MIRKNNSNGFFGSIEPVVPQAASDLNNSSQIMQQSLLEELQIGRESSNFDAINNQTQSDSDESEDEAQIVTQIRELEEDIQQKTAQWHKRFSLQELIFLYTVLNDSLPEQEESREVCSPP
ncbi:MAG: hypothetical protein Q8M03_02545 [Legionella sp.]|nr:hypothetical protein [Legionella sp.]